MKKPADRMAPPGWSLKHRLLGLLLLLAGVISALSVLFAYRAAHREAEQTFDAQLILVAEALSAIATDAGPDHATHEFAYHDYRGPLPIAYQVWSLKAPDALLLRSADAPAVAMARTDGFSEAWHENRHWRFYQLRAGGLRIVTGQDHSTRDTLARELTLRILLPFLIGVPILALAIWLTVGQALRPVTGLAAAVEALEPDTLTPVASPLPPPREIAPLLRALNRLIERMASALANEQRFTADAAHELRTPLAALRIQAQVASRATAPADRERALAQVLNGVDRMHHLVEQLLTLARLEPTRADADFIAVDLAEVATISLHSLGNAAAARQQSIDCMLAPACVTGNPVWLGIVARNLLDNAIRYTPPGGRIVLHTGQHDGHCVLEIADNGPGLDATAREGLRARFARGSNIESEGCGLGLSIVDRIVNLHGGTLQLADGLPRACGDGDGLTTVVALPCAKTRIS